MFTGEKEKPAKVAVFKMSNSRGNTFAGYMTYTKSRMTWPGMYG